SSRPSWTITSPAGSARRCGQGCRRSWRPEIPAKRPAHAACARLSTRSCRPRRISSPDSQFRSTSVSERVFAMWSRRQFLTRTLKGSSLVALSSIVPGFVSRTAQAAPPGKDHILVVLEMTGGNDGLNTVVPYADDLYHKARPTLRQSIDQVIRLDDH